jgi:hypothetical protein
MTDAKPRRPLHLPPTMPLLESGKLQVREKLVKLQEQVREQMREQKAAAVQYSIEQDEFARRIDDHISGRYLARQIVRGLARQKQQQDGPQIKRVKEALREVYPPKGRVPEHLKTNEVEAAVRPVFKARGWRFASRTHAYLRIS